jgi:circadian clock protein KaiC
MKMMMKKLKNKKESNIQKLVKIKTGIGGFDEISRGGIPKGRTTLLSGTSGSGKTLFSMQFLYNGAVSYNEPGVFVTFEETPKDIIKNVESFGWDISSLIDNKKFIFVDASPDDFTKIEAGDYDLSGFLERIKFAIKQMVISPLAD